MRKLIMGVMPVFGYALCIVCGAILFTASAVDMAIARIFRA